MIICVSAGFFLHSIVLPQHEQIVQAPSPTVELIKCAQELSGGKSSDISVLNAASDLCYKAVYNETLINDFAIRRNLYMEQPYLDRVLLWTVVFITISGVILSAMQLITSYKLTVLGKLPADASSNLIIEKDKITLQSSVVGLFILTISLVFFVIFVYGVYTIKENKSDSIASIHGVSDNNSGGGLGRPPAQKAPAVEPPAAAPAEAK